MNAVALTDISCQIDVETLLEKLRIKQDSAYLAKIQDMVAEAQPLAKPKAVYKETYVDLKGDNFVVIDGIRFTSHVLRVNMEETFRAFPFVVTCGTELEDWSGQFEDYFDSFCADAIKEMFLRSACHELEVHLDQQYGLGHAVNMNPGSLADWPIKDQKPLFELLGNVGDLIGVRLLASFLMFPVKTVSGIRFSSESNFENCQLCSRENCPGRKAPYDQGLYERKYQLKNR